MAPCPKKSKPHRQWRRCTRDCLGIQHKWNSTWKWVFDDWVYIQVWHISVIVVDFSLALCSWVWLGSLIVIHYLLFVIARPYLKITTVSWHGTQKKQVPRCFDSCWYSQPNHKASQKDWSYMLFMFSIVPAILDGILFWSILLSKTTARHAVIVKHTVTYFSHSKMVCTITGHIIHV